MARPLTEPAGKLVTTSIQLSQADIDAISRLADMEAQKTGERPSWAKVARQVVRAGLKQLERESR